MTIAPEFSATIRLRLAPTEDRDDHAVLHEFRRRTSLNADVVVLDSGEDDDGPWADVTMSGSYQEVMTILMMLPTPLMPTKSWRFHIGRFLVHLGIRVMPRGRVRSELTALLWAWTMKVQATLAAKRSA